MVPGGDLGSIQRVGILSRCRGSSPLPALASTWKRHCHLRPRQSKANWSSPPRACPLLACFEPCTGVEARTPNIVGSSFCSRGPISPPPMVALSVHPPHGLPPHSFSPYVPQNCSCSLVWLSPSVLPPCALQQFLLHWLSEHLGSPLTMDYLAPWHTSRPDPISCSVRASPLNKTDMKQPSASLPFLSNLEKGNPQVFLGHYYSEPPALGSPNQQN